MNSYKRIGNRLYILTHNGLYQRVKLKLPESIRCISELEKYDYQYSKKPGKPEYYPDLSKMDTPSKLSIKSIVLLDNFGLYGRWYLMFYI